MLVLCVLSGCLLPRTLANHPDIAGKDHVTYEPEFERVSELKGFKLAGHKISAAFTSDAFDRKGDSGFSERVELDVSASARQWAARCTFAYGTLLDWSGACDFQPDDGGRSAALVIGKGERGFLLGARELEVEWNFFNLQAMELLFRRRNGEVVATWAWAPKLGYSLALNTYAIEPEELELVTLAVLVTLPLHSAATTPNIVAPNASQQGRLDSYPLVDSSPRELGDQRERLLSLEAMGAKTAAALLEAHLNDPRKIDRVAGGALVQRNPSMPRLAFGLEGGPVVVPNSEGTPKGVGGGIDMMAGLRSRRWLFGLTMGLRLGDFDGRASDSTGGRDVMSAGFSLGTTVRYALPLVSSVEATLGLSLAARMRFADVQGWPEGSGSAQFGAAFGPIVGLQVPIWTLNDLGSRLLLTLDTTPEMRFWTTPGIEQPAGEDAVARSVKAALSGRELAVRSAIGLRFEL